MLVCVLYAGTTETLSWMTHEFIFYIQQCCDQRQTDRQTYTHRDRQNGRHTHTDSKTDIHGEADREIATNRHSDRHTDNWSSNHISDGENEDNVFSSQLFIFSEIYTLI